MYRRAAILLFFFLLYVKRRVDDDDDDGTKITTHTHQNETIQTEKWRGILYKQLIFLPSVVFVFFAAGANFGRRVIQNASLSALENMTWR